MHFILLHPPHTSTQTAATRKMVTEFQYMRAHSVEPLSTFMDYIAIEYMIENVMLLLKGTLRFGTLLK
jgi:V-type H+-transporting ATPase subunit d